MEIEVTANPSMEDDSFIIDKTREYNNYFVENNCQPLSVYVRSEYGEIIAGLTAKTFWKWLHIDYLYVSKDMRKKI